MKKNVNDYKTADGKNGIYCKNAKEFDDIARLVNPHHFAIGKYMENGYNTIYLYSTGCGWNTREQGVKTGCIIYNAFEFLEETEDEPLFIN